MHAQVPAEVKERRLYRFGLSSCSRGHSDSKSSECPPGDVGEPSCQNTACKGAVHSSIDILQGIHKESDPTGFGGRLALFEVGE
jgi:hypothetical protein